MRELRETVKFIDEDGIITEGVAIRYVDGTRKLIDSLDNVRRFPGNYINETRDFVESRDKKELEEIIYESKSEERRLEYESMLSQIEAQKAVDDYHWEQKVAKSACKDLTERELRELRRLGYYDV
jgi:hypothetical protein